MAKKFFYAVLGAGMGWVALVVPSIVTADELGIDLDIQGVSNILYSLVCWLERFGVALAVIFIVIAGIQLMASSEEGKEGSMIQARKRIQWVLIGLVVMLCINIIMSVVASVLGVDFSPYLIHC